MERLFTLTKLQFRVDTIYFLFIIGKIEWVRL